MENYSNQQLFLGIDVHKKTYTISAVCNGTVVKKATIPAFPEQLIAYCHKYFNGSILKTAYEAGWFGFDLHRQLEKAGIENRVIHPASIETVACNKVKTDKRDSEKIATQLAAGRLSGIFVPDKKQEDRRAITRLREVLIRHRVRVGNQLKAFLALQGKVKTDEIISARWIEKTRSCKDFSEEIQFVINNYAEMWLSLRQRIKAVNQQLKLQVSQDNNLEKIYRSVPGIGETAARVLANELGDMSQFSNEKKLFSFLGLTPREYSSGEHQRTGHISRQGRSVLRKILVQSAWIAVRDDLELREIYERIAHRAGGRRAIIGIARRLAGRIRACLKEKKLYLKRK